MIKGILAGSRYIIIFAVIAAFAGSATILVISALTVLRLAWAEITEFEVNRLTAHHVERLGVQLIQITDIFLLGTVMYIVALGLYQLFVDQRLPLPEWLRIRNLAELKSHLIAVTAVLLGVTFLGQAVDWTGDDGILVFGAATALVIAALALFSWLSPHGQSTHANDENNPGQRTKDAPPAP